ncbi:MAG TPA: serine/threonine-protein kinase [Polyangiaceae bacterium]
MPANEPSSDSTNSLVGRIVLGRYRVVRPLARGGMGYVYLGRVEGAAGFAKPVVVKTVLASVGNQDSQRLFAREARIVANLQHPGIVAVIDFGQVEDACVMVLEYVHGYHLGQWLRFVNDTRGNMPVELALHVVLEVLDALSFAHGLVGPDGKPLAIVHRDISPANVLIDSQGHVKLSDFGIARMAEDEFKTQEGLFRGTLPYSAPEALRGEPPDPKLDQYGCGVVLYHLLAGKNPFKGAEPPETLTRVLTHTPPPLSSLRSDVPAGIDAAIARAISKEPADRFASVAEFAQALRAGGESSERAVAGRFRAQISQDFGGDVLAEHLRIESLAVRDASWREAQNTTVSRVSLSSSPPGMQSGVRPQHSASQTTAVVGPTAKTRDEAVRPAPSRIGLWIGLAALAAGAGSAAVLLTFSRNAPEAPPGLVVIEKQTEERGSTPVEGPSAVPLPATPPVPVSAAPVPPAPRPSAQASKAPDDRGASLARALQRQESRIQSCFQQHAPADGQAPKMSVRIKVDATGGVQEAVVSPSSVGVTPLGNCIATIVKATQFGAQPEPVSFTIPIAARVVRP